MVLMDIRIVARTEALGRYDSVQFLRFAAATAVVVHHLSTALGSPINVFAAGVDVFFVISGFVMAVTTSSRDSAAAFFKRRLIRIYPIYWLATAAYILFKFAAWGDIPAIEDAVRSALLLPQLGVQWHPIYFPAWTLVYEVAFYVLFAGLLLIAPRNFKTLSLVALIALASVNITAPGGQAYLASNLLLEFAFGIFIGMTVRFEADRPGLGLIICICGVLLFAANWSSAATARPIGWGLPAMLIVFGCIRMESLRFFHHRVPILLGDASYSIYLTHITVIQAVHFYSARLFGWAIDNSIAATIFIVFPATLLVGVTVHVAIERPLLHWLRRLTSRRPTLAAATS